MIRLMVNLLAMTVMRKLPSKLLLKSNSANNNLLKWKLIRSAKRRRLKLRSNVRKKLIVNKLRNKNALLDNTKSKKKNVNNRQEHKRLNASKKMPNGNANKSCMTISKIKTKMKMITPNNNKNHNFRCRMMVNATVLSMKKPKN